MPLHNCLLRQETSVAPRSGDFYGVEFSIQGNGTPLGGARANGASGRAEGGERSGPRFARTDVGMRRM